MAASDSRASPAGETETEARRAAEARLDAGARYGEGKGGSSNEVSSSDALMAIAICVSSSS